MTKITEDHWVQLTTLAPKPKPKKKNAKKERKALPQVLLTIHRWKEVEATAKKVAAKLTIFECDFTTDPDRYPSHPLGVFNLKLQRVKRASGATPRVQVVSAQWRREARYKGKAALKNRFEQFPPTMRAFELLFDGKGRRRIKLACPNFSGDTQGFRGEGTAFELGFKLEVGTQTFDRSTWEIGQSNHIAHVKVKTNWPKFMLKVGGRFDDRKNISEAEQALEHDGRLALDFQQSGRTRIYYVERYAKTLGKIGYDEATELGTSDIAKAWLVIHDVGNKDIRSLKDSDTSIVTRDTHSEDRRGARMFYKDGSASERGVHGFLSPDGSFLQCCDFVAHRTGTGWEQYNHGGATYRGTCIHIETVPIILALSNTEANKVSKIKKDERNERPEWVRVGTVRELRRRGTEIMDYFAEHEPIAKAVLSAGGHMGWKLKKVKRGLFQAYGCLWTSALLDSLANIYLYGSYRAGHLLTVTCHVEVDRGIPDGHNDPRGMNVQELYDRIAKTLTPDRYAGAPLPKGARFGIHPARVRVNDTSAENFGEAIGPQAKSHQHVWPRQSQPKIQRK